MISLWWLLLIIPLSASVGFLVAGLCVAASKEVPGPLDKPGGVVQ